jgi:mannose-1-phosphate guanylyltransferase
MTMPSSYYAVIMAGGGGTRLWPLSRKDRPKQSLELLGERTMFQISIDRLAPLFTPDRILVVTSAAYARDLRQQCPALPEENFVLEPGPRGTAPAIGLAALHVRKRDPQAIMACLTADHFMGDEKRFRELLSAAAEVAGLDYLVTLGVQPSFASTGFGYIQRAESLGTYAGFEAFRAARFKEKPVESEARAMLADGLHSWNSGMFVWRVERILAEFERQMPEFYEILREIESDPDALKSAWERTPDTTLDYGIMEGAGQVAVIPAAGLGWNDIGSWQALLEVLQPDAAGNVVIGADHLTVGTSGTLVHAGGGQRRLVATLGLTDMVIVDTGDVLFICPRDRSQDVRQVVDRLKQRTDADDYL